MGVIPRKFGYFKLILIGGSGESIEDSRETGSCEVSSTECEKPKYNPSSSTAQSQCGCHAALITHFMLQCKGGLVLNEGP